MYMWQGNLFLFFFKKHWTYRPYSRRRFEGGWGGLPSPLLTEQPKSLSLVYLPSLFIPQQLMAALRSSCLVHFWRKPQQAAPAGNQRHMNGIEHPVNFLNKTHCADSWLYTNEKWPDQQNLSKSTKSGRQKAHFWNVPAGVFFRPVADATS